MKTLIVTTLVLSSTTLPAFAGSDMGNMGMDNMKMPASGMAMPSDTTLTDAVVKKVDAGTGMVTLQHGELKNVGMPAMTMAFKAKDAALVRQAHEGDKVKVRVENIGGTMTIVKMEKQAR